MQNGDKGVIIENLAKVHEFIKDRDQGMLKNLEVALGYLKNMSHQNSADFEFHEEMEWLIVHLDRLKDQYITIQDASQHSYGLKINPDDVKILVFSDHKTKMLALSDPDICRFFAGDFPMITIVEDCCSF